MQSIKMKLQWNKETRKHRQHGEDKTQTVTQDKSDRPRKALSAEP